MLTLKDCPHYSTVMFLSVGGPVWYTKHAQEAYKEEVEGILLTLSQCQHLHWALRML